MPIFEYICKDCDHSFEALVRGENRATCPKCQGENLGQRFSVFSAAVKTAPSAQPSSCCAPSGGACGMGGCCMDN